MDDHSRSNALPDLHNKVYAMLEEVNQLNRRVFTDEQRKYQINDIVDADYDSMDRSLLKEILVTGIRGYADYTDMELIEEQMTRHYNDMYTDSEFEDHSVYFYIESALNSCAKELLTEAVEKHIIKE